MTPRPLRIVSLLLLAGACGDEDAPPPDATPADARFIGGALGFTARHYDVAVDLATLHARVDVTLAITSAGNCLSIPFRPAAADEVLLGELPARDVVVADGRLVACSGTGFPVGAEVVLAVSHELPRAVWADSQVGFSTWTDGAGRAFDYLVSWVGGCDRHGPCDSEPSRFATYRFTVDHAEGRQVFCPGTITRTPTRTVCDFAHAGGPTYSTFALMAGDVWDEVPLGDWGGVSATLYDHAETGIAAAFDRGALSGMFSWLSSEFGPYAYGDELRFVTAPTYWAGFEHPGNIVLSDELATGASSYADGLTHVTMHELAHQWAGNHTTLAGTYDFVWKEAMAEYLTYVYEDEHLGTAVAAQTAAAWKAWALYSRFHLVPTGEPALLDYYGDVYGPGPMVLFRQLEARHGRAPVMTALRSLIGGAAPRALSVVEVEQALEDAIGVDLDGYFAGWVHGTGRPRWPRARVTLATVASGTEISVATSTLDDVARGCAFSVRLVGATEFTDVPFDLGLDMQPLVTTVVPLTFEVLEVELDPRAECLIYPATGGKPERGSPERVEPWRVATARRSR